MTKDQVEGWSIGAALLTLLFSACSIIGWIGLLANQPHMQKHPFINPTVSIILVTMAPLALLFNKYASFLFQTTLLLDKIQRMQDTIDNYRYQEEQRRKVQP